MDSRRDVRSPARDDLCIDRIERLPKRVVIKGKRTLQECIAGKSDQADSVAVQVAEQIFDRHLGPREPVRLDVLGEHAFGSIYRNQQVESVAFDFLRTEPNQWS